MVLDPVRYDFEAEDGGLWTVRRFSLAEGLSGLYACDVELTHAGAEEDVEALLGSSCAVTLSRGGGIERRAPFNCAANRRYASMVISG